MAGVVFIPWYATGFHGDDLEEALAEIAPLAMRFGATDYGVYRGREDRYKFLQTSSFEDKTSFERYWYSDEFNRFRSDCSSFFQIPVLYSWNDLVTAGALEPSRASE